MMQELLKISSCSCEPVKVKLPPYVPSFLKKPLCPKRLLLQDIQGNNDFGPVPQHFAPGPARVEFPDAWAHYAPVRDYPQVQVDLADNLGRLARGYMDHPDSQVTQVDRVVRMEPGQARRFKVVITLEMSDAI
jgi:hypothetical protein